jgi:hypothetical protein
MAICSFISPFVLCFPCYFLFLISTSRHNTTNFLSRTQQTEAAAFSSHTLIIIISSSHISQSSSSRRRC